MNDRTFPYSDERMVVEKIESLSYPESRGIGKALLKKAGPK